MSTEIILILVYTRFVYLTSPRNNEACFNVKLLKLIARTIVTIIKMEINIIKAFYNYLI